jgi:uncharacterized protein (TIGR01777 family)
MSLFFTLITIQAVLGALDNLWHHEITERLPAKRAAATELSLHAAREFLYAFVFLALAWWEWRGEWAYLVAAVLVAEIIITVTDFVVEDRTRRLPAFERVLHTILALNYGVALAVLVPILIAWGREPTQLVFVNYGAFSTLLTIFSVGVFAWSVRNTLAVLHHRRPQEWVRNPIVAGPSSSRSVLITGATGFVGGHLTRKLIARGDAITVLTRDADHALDRFGPHVRIVTSLDSISEDERIDAIINLAGAPILGFWWTRRRRQTLLDSRLHTTRALVTLCARLKKTPRIFVTASAVGYYGIRGNERIDEQGSPQTIFQSQLCQQWEDAAAGAETLGARVVRLRIGLVLGRDGGALPSLALPVRLGLGAILGAGTQWVSWIHIDDLVRLFEFALDRPTLRGPVNAVAPHAATHLQMQRALAHALHRPMPMRVPAFVVRAGLGEMSQLLMDGQRVVPRRAIASGFTFRHADLVGALKHLVGKRAVRTELTEIYFNGACPACIVEMSHYERLCQDSEKSLKFIDAIRHPDGLTECGLRLDHLERRVYLKDSDGRILSGLPALLQLWARLPGYRWLARIVSLPLLRGVVAVGYDHLLAPSVVRWGRAKMRSHAVSTPVS